MDRLLRNPLHRVRARAGLPARDLCRIVLFYLVLLFSLSRCFLNLGEILSGRQPEFRIHPLDISFYLSPLVFDRESFLTGVYFSWTNSKGMNGKFAGEMIPYLDYYFEMIMFAHMAFVPSAELAEKVSETLLSYQFCRPDRLPKSLGLPSPPQEAELELVRTDGRKVAIGAVKCSP